MSACLIEELGEGFLLLGDSRVGRIGRMISGVGV